MGELAYVVSTLIIGRLIDRLVVPYFTVRAAPSAPVRRRCPGCPDSAAKPLPPVQRAAHGRSPDAVLFGAFVGRSTRHSCTRTWIQKSTKS